MARRPITTLCPEGWYYVFVITFILGGAALRGMNLLVILGGALIGPLLFNWRLARLMLRRVRVERQLPARVFAGQTVTVSVVLHNDRSVLTSWAVMVEDRIRRVDTVRLADADAIRVMVPCTAPRQSRVGSYRALLSQRGGYRFGPLRVSSRFPLGLAKAQMKVNEADQLFLVRPRLGRTTRRWVQVTQQQQHVGSQRTSRQHGLLEGDYYGLREWRPGDSQRWIHWRTSAKLGELSVRQFEQQRNRDLTLILDLWQPAEPTDADRVVAETAISFLATAVGETCQRGGTLVTVGVAGETVAHWSGAASSVLAAEVWDYLAVVRAGQGEVIPEILDRVRHRAHPNSQTLVISTRSQAAVGEADMALAGRDLDRRKLTWIDCSKGEETEFFQLDDSGDAETVG